MPCPKGWSLLCISFSCHLLLQQKYCKCNQSDVTKEETAGRSWGGFSLYRRRRGKTHEPFREETGNKQRSRSVNPAFYFSGGFLHQPLPIFHLVSDLSPLLFPHSLCQISFPLMDPTSRKFQDHLQKFTVPIASYLELSYKKYYIAFVIKSLPDCSNKNPIIVTN